MAENWRRKNFAKNDEFLEIALRGGIERKTTAGCATVPYKLEKTVRSIPSQSLSSAMPILSTDCLQGLAALGPPRYFETPGGYLLSRG